MWLQIAIRLIGCFGGALNYWYHFANSGKEISLASDPEDSVATNFLKLLNGDPAFTVRNRKVEYQHLASSRLGGGF